MSARINVAAIKVARIKNKNKKEKPAFEKEASGMATENVALGWSSRQNFGGKEK